MSNLLRAFVSFSNGRSAHLMRVRDDSFQPVLSSSAVTSDGDDGEFTPFQISLMKKALQSRKPEALFENIIVEGRDRNCDGLEPNLLTALGIPIFDCDVVRFVVVIEAIENFDRHSSMIFKASELFATALASVLGSAIPVDQTQTELHADFLVSRPNEQGSISPAIESAVLTGVAETIANELNDPLSAVVSHSAAGLQWLNQVPPDYEKAKNSFRKITSSAFGVGRVISSYRNSSSGQRRATHIPVEEAVSEALQYIQLYLHGDEMAVDNAIDTSATIFGERRMVVQAIINVLSASMDAAASTNLPSGIAIRGSVENGYFELKVSNNDQIVGQEARDAFFDPIYSLKAGNCGIKLAVARNIALLEGGGLEIASTSRRGTTLVLKLPIHEN